MSEAQPAEFQIKEQNVDDNILTLKVEVDPEVVSGAFKRVHKAIASQVKVPGFRSGKIPMPVLVQYVGKDNFLKEVRRELLPQYYYSAMEGLAHKPISEVTYSEDAKLIQGEAFTFQATVAVAPKVELADYEKLDVQKPGQAEVTEAEIDGRVEQLRQRFAKTENAPDSELATGQLALVNIEVQIDGNPYQTLGRKNVTMEAGKDQYLTGFDQNVLGHKRGDDFEFTMKLEGESVPERLRGKDAQFHVQLKAIRNVNLPAITDDFAKDLGFLDLAGLREKLRAEVLREKVGTLEEQAVDGLKKSLVALIDIEPPASTVDKRIEEHMTRLRDRIKGKGVDFETWMKEEGRDENELKADARKGIVDEMKLDFALDAVAEREKVEVDDEEVEHRISAMARALGKRADEVMELLDQSGSRILTKQDIAREHALDRLKEKLLGFPPEEHEHHSHAGHDHEGHDHAGHSH